MLSGMGLNEGTAPLKRTQQHNHSGSYLFFVIPTIAPIVIIAVLICRIITWCGTGRPLAIASLALVLHATDDEFSGRPVTFELLEIRVLILDLGKAGESELS